MDTDSNKYKKVLIISDFNLSGNSATDITMRSYFADWPKDKLFILSTTQCKKPFAKTYVVKTNNHHNIRSIFSKLLLKSTNTLRDRNITPGAIVKTEGVEIGLKQKIFAIGASYADLLKIKIGSKLKAALDNFKPEIIYTVMGSIRINRLVLSVSDSYKLNIIPHFMDDWISTKYTGTIWFYPPKKILVQSVKKLLKKANFGFCICEKMCTEYETRFHKKFYPLMNTVKYSVLLPKNKAENELKSDVFFTYFGGLHVNRWKSLNALSDALYNVSLKINKNLILEIYTSVEFIKNFSSNFNRTNIRFFENVSHESAFQKMQQTNYLVHVESFDEQVIQFTRLSLSTKIPEYLAAGRPVFAIGPSSVASIEYLQENECAYVVTSLAANDIEKELTIAFNDSRTETILKNSMLLFRQNHSDNQLTIFTHFINN